MSEPKIIGEMERMSESEYADVRPERVKVINTAIEYIKYQLVKEARLRLKIAGLELQLEIENLSKLTRIASSSGRNHYWNALWEAHELMKVLLKRHDARIKGRNK